jgi:membrane protein implicated in regulation of membrane protease activity
MRKTRRTGAADGATLRFFPSTGLLEAVGMFASDPLSLVFLFCMFLSGGFLIVTAALGAGHNLHIGAHDLHLGGHVGGDAGGHGAHIDAGHAAGHITNGHTGAHVDAHAHGATGGDVSAPGWQSVTAILNNGLNLYGLLIFLFVFGLFGYVLHNLTNVGAVASVILPLLFGAASGLALGNFLVRFFRTSPESLLDAESSRLEGRLGKVSMTIREGGVGEVIFTGKGGGRQSMSARSADGQPISAGANIVILGYQDGVARVQTWDSFLLESRSGQQPLLGPLETQQ